MKVSTNACRWSFRLISSLRNRSSQNRMNSSVTFGFASFSSAMRKKPEKKTETSGKKVSVNRKKLQDFDYLRQTFYQVDNTTTIGKNQLDVDKLMKPDLRIDQSVDGPQILIYHTHSQERYADSKDEKTGVVGVGDYLTELLEEEGFQVMHHKGEYDVGDRDHAYSKAAPSEKP